MSDFILQNVPGSGGGGGVSSVTGDGTIVNNSASTGAVTLTLANTPTGTGGVVLKNSPALTGSPTAPTQATGDNSTLIATDAFVTTAINNASYRVVSQTTTYTAAPFDDVWCTGTFTVTTPPAVLGTRFKVANRSTGVVTVAASSGTIVGNASMQLGTQFSSVEIVSDGTNWTVE